MGAAIGTDALSEERIRALLDAEVDLLMLDTAHAHSKNVVKMMQKVQQMVQNGG